MRPLQTLCCCPPAQHEDKIKNDGTTQWHAFFHHFNYSVNSSPSYLEADILQVVRVPFDDLFDEVWVCGLQVGTGWLGQFKLKAAPQLWHVEGLIPAATHLQKGQKKGQKGAT